MEASDNFLKNLVGETQKVSSSLKDGIDVINKGLDSPQFKQYKDSLDFEKQKDLAEILKGVGSDLSKSMEALSNISKVK